MRRRFRCEFDTTQQRLFARKHASLYALKTPYYYNRNKQKLSENKKATRLNNYYKLPSSCEFIFIFSRLKTTKVHVRKCRRSRVRPVVVSFFFLTLRNYRSNVEHPLLVEPV